MQKKERVLRRFSVSFMSGGGRERKAAGVSLFVFKNSAHLPPE